MFGVLDCPRTLLNNSLSDGNTWIPGSQRNLILLFGSKTLCKSQNPIFWALANLLKNSRRQNGTVNLPDALIYRREPDELQTQPNVVE